MIILHIYPTIRDAKNGFHEFVMRTPDRFSQDKLWGQLGDNSHFFLGLGLWSQFGRMAGIKANRVHLYFLPGQRTLSAIKIYSRVPPQDIHYYTKEVFYAG